MVGFGVSYKFLSSFNVWSRWTNTFSKSHHCANTNVAGNFSMTIRLTILILLTSFVTLAQNNVAIIVDKDGYTNVRQGKSTNSPIVGQIKKGEFFTFKTTTDDWFEIYKTFREDGTSENLNGFVHKSRVQPINTLPDKDKRELIKQTFEKELDLIKTKNWDERKKHHEPKFDVILNVAADYIIKTRDKELLRIFIETVKLDTGSADETPSWTLGYIFIKQPDWTIEQMRNVGLTQDLIERLDFGFENVVTKSDDYSKLKNKIKLLE